MKIRRRHARRGSGRGIQPGRDAAIRKIAVIAGEVELRIERPTLASRGRIDGADAAEGSRDEEQPVHENRGRLIAGLRAADAVVAGAVDPCRRQGGDVGARDLIGRRILRAARVAAVRRPLNWPASRARRGKHSDGEQRGEGRSKPLTHFVKHMSGSPPGFRRERGGTHREIQ